MCVVFVVFAVGRAYTVNEIHSNAQYSRLLHRVPLDRHVISTAHVLVCLLLTRQTPGHLSAIRHDHLIACKPFGHHTTLHWRIPIRLHKLYSTPLAGSMIACSCSGESRAHHACGVTNGTQSVMFEFIHPLGACVCVSQSGVGPQYKLRYSW